MTRQKNDEITGTLTYMKKRGSLKIFIILLIVGIALLIIGASGLLEKEPKKAEGNVEEEKNCTFLELYGQICCQNEINCASLQKTYNKKT